MKRKIITTAFALLFATAGMAQDVRVAVFDPTGNAPSFINEIVREEISFVIVNTGGYTVLERSLINQVLEESRFQASGLVDDAEISELGRMLGANLALVTNITRMSNGNFHISARLIDVLTARVERQQTARTARGESDIIEAVEQIATTMFGRPETTQTIIETRPANQALIGSMLVTDGRWVYQDGRRLTEGEVRGLMAGTDALRLYNQGLQRRRNGDILFWSGIGIIGVGLVAGGAILSADMEFWEDVFFPTVGGTAISGGIVMITGVVLRTNSRRPIQNSVDMHNRSVQTSHIEFNFGLTPNGVGMVVNF